MPELTNLTDRLAHLRDRKGSQPLVTRNQAGQPLVTGVHRKLPERRFANDYFMVFVYALLGIAICSQFVLIAWLDVI